MSRRAFLRAAGGGAAGAAALCGLPAALLPRSARADDLWGAWPAAQAQWAVPAELQPQNILELYLYGGVSPWETFYCVPEADFGQATNQMWWTFQEGPDGVPARYAECLGASAPPLLQPFATDQNGVMVCLGPFLEPMRSRTDIVDRMRLHVMSHDYMPHEVAVPLALTGYLTSAPRMAGVGTAVQHYFLARNPSPDEPYSYFISPLAGVFTDIFAQATSVGAHPAACRPLSLHVNTDSTFVTALQRQGAGPMREAADALLANHMGHWAQGLMYGGNPVRSSGRDDYTTAFSMLGKATELVPIFDPSYFQAVSGQACGATVPVSNTAMQLRLAAHLLARPGSGVRHLTVADSAAFNDLNAGYDTHAEHVYDSSRNLGQLFTALCAVINQPGENNPDKINLDNTLVIINTEFGRSPGTQNGDGRNHFPSGYVTAMFGGPIGPAQKGIVGAIGPTAYPTEALAPAETRIASLAALGIWPFTPEGYSPSDMVGCQTDTDAATKIARILGIAG